MNLTFTDPREFEDFATAYLLGAMMLRGGGILVADFDPKRLTKGAIAEARALVAHAKAQPEFASTRNPQSGDMGGDGLPIDPEPETPATDEGVVHEHIDLPPADETEQEVEKPKRKRRTKAEIEAEAQHIADEAAKEADDKPEGYVAQLEAADVKVIEAREADELSAVMEHVPAEGQEKLPDVPKDAPEPTGASADAVEKHAAAQAEYTPELIETLEGQAELFDANRTAHLNEGREAIAKHGFIKYMATFKGLGLDSAIATYNDDQVKLHRAAIAHLMAA